MTLTFRDLRLDEFERLGEIDRGERIDGEYALVDGRLALTPCDVDVAGWYPEELTGYVARLHELSAHGGVVLGALDEATLLALGSLDAAPVGSDPAVLQLDMLYVSRPARHRRVGTQLVERLAERARALGAVALYISATPTRNTVDAYLRMGAVVLERPDPRIFALEPDDIHLLLAI